MLLYVLLAVLAGAVHGYEIPEPKFKILRPRGFRVSIPDEHGIQLFAFHANVNGKLMFQGDDMISGDVITRINNRWVYENKKFKLREGDFISYWIFVFKSGKGYWKKDGLYKCEGTEFHRQVKKHYLKKRHAHFPGWEGSSGFGRPQPFGYRKPWPTSYQHFHQHHQHLQHHHSCPYYNHFHDQDFGNYPKPDFVNYHNRVDKDDDGDEDKCGCDDSEESKSTESTSAEDSGKEPLTTTEEGVVRTTPIKVVTTKGTGGTTEEVVTEVAAGTTTTTVIPQIDIRIGGDD